MEDNGWEISSALSLQELTLLYEERLYECIDTFEKAG